MSKAPASDWPDVSPAGLRNMAEIAAPNNGAVFRAAADEIERLSARAETSTPTAGEREDALRRALEIIALGDAQNPQAQAAEDLIALGFWRDIPEARAALAAQPEPAAQDIEDAERWCWYHEGDERVTVLHSESEAHGEAQQWINENCEPDEEHEYLVAPMKSGLDLLGSPGHIGETIIENINENLSDEMGAEEDPIDMSKDDIAKLGELVRQFVRSEGKVQWWTIDTKREAKHAARAATKPQGGA